MPGVFYNTAAVIDADGRYLGKHRKNHIPQVAGFWEKFYFRPGNLGLPGLRHRRRPHRRLHLLRAPLPRGLARARTGGSQDRLQPFGDEPGLSEYLWRLEQPAAAVANEYFVGTINRVGVEPLGSNEFYGQSYFVDPRGQFVGEVASDVEEAVIVRDLDLGVIDDVRRLWAFYRDRRPETYGPLCEA